VIDGLGFEVVTITLAPAQRVAHAYELWGKGVHPAALNRLLRLCTGQGACLPPALCR
jgi:uncharacterized protein with PIN domain